MKKKDFSEFTITEIEEIAYKASSRARQKALDARLKVGGADMNGNIIIEKKNADGIIMVKVIPSEEYEPNKPLKWN